MGTGQLVRAHAYGPAFLVLTVRKVAGRLDRIFNRQSGNRIECADFAAQTGRTATIVVGTDILFDVHQEKMPHEGCCSASDAWVAPAGNCKGFSSQ